MCHPFTAHLVADRLAEIKVARDSDVDLPVRWEPKLHIRDDEIVFGFNRRRGKGEREPRIALQFNLINPS